MNLPHPIRFHRASDPQSGIDARFDEVFLRDARRKTLDALEAIRSRIVPGMTEDDARRLALEVFSERGVDRHWHKPYIRFGPGTAMTFHEPLQRDYRLKEGDPFYIDLGPVWSADGLEYEGDYGDTFVLGENADASRCADTARKLFREASILWRENRATGEEIYAFLDGRTRELGYELLEPVDGHRIGDFPHQKYSRERLAKLPHAPAETVWVLEIQIVEPNRCFGAFFEDLLGTSV